MNAAKLMKAIAKFLIATILVQLGIWLFLWINALNTINEAMDVLVGKSTEANCIDGPTGEYDDMTSILLRTNLENPFFQYPIHISSYSRVESAGSDLYKYNIVDGTRNGNDGFTVRKSDGSGAYSFATAGQRFDPLTVELTGYLYLPLLFYVDRGFDENFVQTENAGMFITAMPMNHKQLALAVKFKRTATVVGTRYYKGLSMNRG